MIFSVLLMSIIYMQSILNIKILMYIPGERDMKAIY
jgi:hypothetical protein